jgi:hypothetical protein
MDWEEKAILQELRQNQRQEQMWLKYGGTAAPNERHILARQVEAKIIKRISPYGWPVNLTTHKAKFDLWIGNAKVEVKGSHWRNRGSFGIYQANIRNHAADVLIFAAINGSFHFFVIPMAAVKPRKTVEISSYHVDAYAGQWSPYLEAWDVLEEAVRSAPARPKQLDLPIGVI